MRPSIKRQRLLAVDGNYDGANSLAMMLRLTGTDVPTFHDGVEALSEAERFRLEVRLMDVGLSNLNG